MSSVISYLSSLASSYGIDFDRDNLIFQTKDLDIYKSFAAELFIYAATNSAFSNAYKITTGQRDDVSWIALIAKPGTPRTDVEPAGTNVCTEVSNDRINIAHIKEMTGGDEIHPRSFIMMEMTGNDGFGLLREKVADIEPEIVPFPSPAKKARDFFNETRTRTLREKWNVLGECELKNILDREWKNRKTLFDESLIQSLQKLAKEDRKRFKAEKKEWKEHQKGLREQHAEKFGRESEERVSRAKRRGKARRTRNVSKSPENRDNPLEESVFYVIANTPGGLTEVILFRKLEDAEKCAEHLRKTRKNFRNATLYALRVGRTKIYTQFPKGFWEL